MVRKAIDAGLTIESLARRLAEGQSIRSIAIEIGVSEWSVATLAKRNGLRRRLWQRTGVLSEIDAAWIAACIDCEGTITIHVPWNKTRQCRNVQAYIRVNMVNRAIPERLQFLCGGTLKQKIRLDRTDNRREQWYWNISANGCRWLLPQILPHILEKKRHAEILIDVLSRNGLSGRMDVEDLRRMLNELRGLNCKGMRNRPVLIPSGELRK